MLQDVYFCLLRRRRRQGVNVLKQHLQSAIFTLLERGVSQRRIHELTGIDRKTIRRYQALHEAQRAAGANSSTSATTGSGDPVVTQTPPPQTPPLPRPPGSGGVPSSSFNFARSASEPYREWIEQQVRLRRNAQAIYQDLVDQHGFTA